MILKPIITEKAVMLIEKENTITFEVERTKSKTDIKQDVEKMFNVKIEKIRTMIKVGNKYAQIKLKKEFPAMDLATKLGVI